MLTERIKNYRLILGSRSPRRRELLESLGLSFELADNGCDEELPASVPAGEAALYLAGRKAEGMVSSLERDQILITADTIVLLDGNILPKPASGEEAAAFLKSLSGREHIVTTGVCIVMGSGRMACFSEDTIVRFSRLDDDEIDYYITHYKPYDKAGAYGIQEWIGFIAAERIEGSYFNVMGLPITRVYQELKKIIE